jgi:hypothetical protein
MVYSQLGGSRDSVVRISIWDKRHWGKDSADSCSKADPRKQRGLTLYTLASRLQKQKAKFNPHMAACDFIGYFIPPSAMWPSCFNSLSFISLLCHPFLLPISFSCPPPYCNPTGGQWSLKSGRTQPDGPLVCRRDMLELLLTLNLFCHSDVLLY